MWRIWWKSWLPWNQRQTKRNSWYLYFTMISFHDSIIKSSKAKHILFIKRWKKMGLNAKHVNILIQLNPLPDLTTMGIGRIYLIWLFLRYWGRKLPISELRLIFNTFKNLRTSNNWQTTLFKRRILVRLLHLIIILLRLLNIILSWLHLYASTMNG